MDRRYCPRYRQYLPDRTCLELYGFQASFAGGSDFARLLLKDYIRLLQVQGLG